MIPLALPVQQPATPDAAAAALAQLDHTPGVYIGCDAGIAGLHPLQATLVTEVAFALQVHESGLEVQALTPWADALLTEPAFEAWHTRARRGAGASPLASLRGLLALFGPDADVLLAGALRFEAWRLAPGAPSSGHDLALGVLYLPQAWLQRDPQGRWTHFRHGVPGDTEAVAGASPCVAHTPPPADDFAPGGHAAMVALAVERLKAPPLVSLTLSQSFRRQASGSPAQAFARLLAVNPAPATFFVNDGAGGCLFGASPDLQLLVHGRTVQTLPVCGTVARRPGPVGEAESLRELFNEAVDAASLAVCSDALRNDLAPLCEPGSLRLVARRRPMSLATVVHTVDHLVGQLREGADAWDAIAATAAPAMVTGTPRAPALAAIAALEASPRGWYGGLTVLVHANGDAQVGTVLRAAWVSDGVAEVRTGGDLLADSVPEREEQESRLKAISLWRALGLDDGGTTAAPTHTRPIAPTVRRIALIDAADPFIAGVRDTLLAQGAVLDGGTGHPAVLVGSNGPACAAALAQRGGQQRLLAWGDAALAVLADAGFAVRRIAPTHGRLTSCHRTARSPWASEQPILVARYATQALAAPAQDLPSGWQAWAVDADGHPLVLVQAATRTVCMLYRPDSMLCEPQALAVLEAALDLICTTIER